MDNEKIQNILVIVLFALGALNIALTAAKLICEKIAETFKQEKAGKIALTIGKIAEILGKILSFVTANTQKK